jgi:hypothetical protein
MKPPLKACVVRYIRLKTGKIAGAEVPGIENYQAKQVNLATTFSREASIVDIVNDEVAGEMTYYCGRIKIAAIECRLRYSAEHPGSRRSSGAHEES